MSGRQQFSSAPAGSRSCATLRRGVSLVELLVSMLILAIVCIAWLEIIGIQSARKEARRREAVERLSGMMDAFLYEMRNVNKFAADKHYVVRRVQGALEIGESKKDYVNPMFDGNVSSVGYRLSVVTKNNLDNAERFGNNWKREFDDCKWLVGTLYNHSGCSVKEAGKPFFTLPVCLWL